MKKLVRLQTDRKLAGVLGGVAQYFNIDSSLIRIIYVLLFIFTGFFPFGLLYLISIYLIPKEEYDY